MKLKTLIISLFCLAATTINAQDKMLGGDLSLVPAYEASGDIWPDADGNNINTTYDDGMIGFVKEKAKWNAVRVRLLVDPTADDIRVLNNDSLATCQDIAYVKAFGKRIKDAGMNFLLDIFYSDTWTDVSKQWIPVSWGMNRSTETATLAAKVKSYTTEVLNELVANGAKPDYVQIGNEVSYGMLWDDLDTRNNSSWFFNNSTHQQAKVERFATLLKAAAEGVRASDAATAKIVLHNERSGNKTLVNNFYTWVEQAGFTDYDVIGLSYYPLWHGYLNALKETLNTLSANFPTKKIQIVETSYHHTPRSTFAPGESNTSATWPYTPAGQASFLNDLIELLNTYDNVDGLYYWQPEECGNGASESGTNRVMNHYDYRGFWSLDWKSSTPHTLNSSGALMKMKKFIGEEDEEEQDVTNKFTNMDFEDCTWNSGGWVDACPGWTINYDMGWDKSWPEKVDQWHSNLTDGYLHYAYASSGTNLSAGNIIYQSASDMPAGTYTVSAAVHSECDAVALFANDDTKAVPYTANSLWGTATIVSVTTTLHESGTLTVGLKLLEKPTTTDKINLYADNFTVKQATTGINNVTPAAKTAINDNAVYDLSGPKWSNSKWSTGTLPKGIYIHNGKKVVIK